MNCPHKNRSRKLVQKQGGTTYIINSCSLCTGIALKSGEFFEVQDFMEALQN